MQVAENGAYGAPDKSGEATDCSAGRKRIDLKTQVGRSLKKLYRRLPSDVSCVGGGSSCRFVWSAAVRPKEEYVRSTGVIWRRIHCPRLHGEESGVTNKTTKTREEDAVDEFFLVFGRVDRASGKSAPRCAASRPYTGAGPLTIARPPTVNSGSRPLRSHAVLYQDIGAGS